MKIKNIRIRNFRTIKDEISIDIEEYLTIVGPNNSGKTNLLKALHLFFTGYKNDLGYDKQKDFSHDVANTSKTTINVTFLKEDSDFDTDLFDDYYEIFEFLEIDITTRNEFTIYLAFNENNPNYQLFSNVKKIKDKQAIYSTKQKAIISKVLAHFSIHYIPTEKSVRELFNSLVTPLLSLELGKRLTENRKIIDDVFDDASKSITSYLVESHLEDFQFSIRPPSNDYSRMIKGFEFYLNDDIDTNVFEKGMGIQTASLLACFLWVTDKERAIGRSVIWLIEEPESFLHPSLVDIHNKLLSLLRQKSLVLNSTHSLQFVPQDPLKVIGTTCTSNITKVQRFKTYVEATKILRSSLGIQFSHFFNLGIYNVFVEGQTDRIYLQDLLPFIPEETLPAPILRSDETKILDFGGTSNLEGFLKTTMEFIQKERPSVSVFDGDAAGIKSTRALQGFFGNKNIRYQSNIDYIILERDCEIEYYFPQSWLQEIYDEQPTWFVNYTKDIQGNLLSFEIVDTKKTNVQVKFFEKIYAGDDDSWIDNWIPIFTALEDALAKQLQLFPDIIKV